VQACLKVITSTCLAHGIEMTCETGKVTDNFSIFVQRYYKQFCEDAIRCMFTCGFVPWRLRKLDSGAWIPEAIPLGTFVWTVERNADHNRSESNNLSKNMWNVENAKRPFKRGRFSTAALSYKIRFIESLGIKEEDVNIYAYVQPMGNHSSFLQSPLAGIVAQYKLILQCLARSEHADEWNTQAKMVCSYHSQANIYSMNEGAPITNDWSVPQNRNGALSDNNLPTEMEQNVYMRDAITEEVVASKKAVHVPTVSTVLVSPFLSFSVYST
jgi:hypothetical protein